MGKNRNTWEKFRFHPNFSAPFFFTWTTIGKKKSHGGLAASFLRVRLWVGLFSDWQRWAAYIFFFFSRPTSLLHTAANDPIVFILAITLVIARWAGPSYFQDHLVFHSPWRFCGFFLFVSFPFPRSFFHSHLMYISHPTLHMFSLYLFIFV